MFDEQDQELGPVLTLVIGIAITVSLFAIAVALSVAGVFSGGAHGPSARAATSRTVAGAARPVHLYFALGSAELPADAAGSLLPIVEAARRDPARRIDVSGFHDASGDAATNAELAKTRAMAVRDALAQAGVAADRIELQKPAQVLGGGDPREARRVDVGLR